MAVNWTRIIRLVAGGRDCTVTDKMAREWAALCEGLVPHKALDILEDKFKGVINGA